jgi:hypothetical protein
MGKPIFCTGIARLFGGGLEAAKQLREPVEEGDRAEPLAVVNGWVAADDLASLDIAGDAALGCGDDAIAYGAVAGDADLSGEYD